VSAAPEFYETPWGMRPLAQCEHEVNRDGADVMIAHDAHPDCARHLCEFCCADTCCRACHAASVEGDATDCATCCATSSGDEGGIIVTTKAGRDAPPNGYDRSELDPEPPPLTRDHAYYVSVLGVYGERLLTGYWSSEQYTAAVRELMRLPRRRGDL
jgi:hypothetical protein